MGKHSIPEAPPAIRSVVVDGETVELPLPGDFIHPATGIRFHLAGAMGWHTGPGYSMNGWPIFWRELVRVED